MTSATLTAGGSGKRIWSLVIAATMCAVVAFLPYVLRLMSGVPTHIGPETRLFRQLVLSMGLIDIGSWIERRNWTGGYVGHVIYFLAVEIVVLGAGEVVRLILRSTISNAVRLVRTRLLIVLLMSVLISAAFSQVSVLKSVKKEGETQILA